MGRPANLKAAHEGPSESRWSQTMRFSKRRMRFRTVIGATFCLGFPGFLFDFRVSLLSHFRRHFWFYQGGAKVSQFGQLGLHADCLPMSVG